MRDVHEGRGGERWDTRCMYTPAQTNKLVLCAAVPSLLLAIFEMLQTRLLRDLPFLKNQPEQLLLLVF